jgi:hypothetical protein
MQRRITIFSLSILLKSILGQPLSVQDPINYESPLFYEKLLSIAFLVLLGGVFAGKKSRSTQSV